MHGPAGHARRDGGEPGQLAGRIDHLFLAGDYMGMPSMNGALSNGHSVASEVADLLASRTSQAASPK